LILLFALFYISPFFTFSQTCTDPNLYGDECDFDGDGLINISDVDDDNDGVLDTTEQDCFLTNNLTEGLAAGAHPMDTWLATHGVRIRHIDVATMTANTTTFNVLNHPSWVAQGDPDNKLIWNGTGVSFAFFAANGVTPETVNSFSVWSDRFPIPPPTGLVDIVVRDINGVDILTRQDPDGSQHIIDISQTAGVGIHEVVLSFSSSAFDLVSLSGSCLDRDTDGDSFADRFDLDSDGDGCSDAFESGATLDISTNFQFTDAGGDPDGLSPTVDPGGDGLPDYTSTYSPDANDNTVNNCPSVLTFQFVALDLIEENGNVHMNWIGSYGGNLSHFTILRSPDLASWEVLDKLELEEARAHENKYSFTDIRPSADFLYYKVLAEDESGSQTQSSIQSIHLQRELSIYPNPFKNQVHLFGSETSLSSIKLMDINGSVLNSIGTSFSPSGEELILNFTHMKGGIYFLRVGNRTYKLVKEG
ncbi:MAG: T9SS type A sorting domain-containing protein, partial [Bacteroidota bacterium]